jgi:hypothetical protein
LTALRNLFREFADPKAQYGMQPEYFMDVFRQFAAHWTTGDIPPSGALDVDALKRDFLLGTVNEHYVQHVHKIMPALLAPERVDLSHRMSEPSLIERLLTSAGLGLTTAGPGAAELTAHGRVHPALGTWYQLLSAHARAAGAHLMLSKRFLFNPQRRRDEEGIGDHPLVSNRRGTTGMNESMIDRLTQMRRAHGLAGLRHAERDDVTPTKVNAHDVQVFPLMADLIGAPDEAPVESKTPTAGDRTVSAR